MQEALEARISSHTDDSVAALNARIRRKLQPRSSEAELLQPPEQKLLQCEQKAKMHSSYHEFNQALSELMRCIALARICYGGHHWKMAEAHLNLAQGYLQLKGFSLQAQQHAKKAKEILLASSPIPSSDSEQRMDILKCSVAIFHTLGRSLTALHKLKDSERNLIKAQKLSEELLQNDHMPQDKWMEIKAAVELSFAQTVLMSGPDYVMTEVRQVAHFIALRKSPSSGEAAETAHLMAQAAVASKQSEHKANKNGHTGSDQYPVFRQWPMPGAPEGMNRTDLAEKYFQESINAFKEAEGMESAKCLGAVDDFCQFLIATGQQERAAIVLKGSLEAKISLCGDLSPEVAETYWLLGGTELAQGHTHLAYKKLKKVGFFDQNILDQILMVLGILLNYVLQCLYLQPLLYGTHNKRTVVTQEAIDLSKAPDVAAKQRLSDKKNHHTVLLCNSTP